MTPNFAELGVSDRVIEALRANGIQAPFPVQSLVIPDAIAGRDVLARSQTGSGKTLAFALPIVERIRQDEPAPVALVLVPTRELAQQVADDFDDVARANGLRVGVAYGGTSVQEQSRGIGKAHVVIATPGRLQDIAERGLIKLERVRILVLDEADRMLDMGFQPQVAKIVRRIPAERQTMFFSATLGRGRRPHGPCLHPRRRSCTRWSPSVRPPTGSPTGSSRSRRTARSMRSPSSSRTTAGSRWSSSGRSAARTVWSRS